MATSDHQKLDVFIGTWHTTGEVATDNPERPVKVDFTDTYTWYPGGFFVLHDAKGTIGGEHSSSLEIIGYDADRHCYTTTFFDSSGGSGKEDLYLEGTTWTWRGSDVMGVKEHRCVGTVSNDGNTIHARHEKSDDGIHWELWMDVVLEKQG